MRAPIAKLRIAAGNPGWYDPLTNIHLTIARPEAFVYEGANTSNIKRGIAHHLLYIVEGSLENNETVESVVVEEQVREVVSETKKVEEKIEATKKEEVVKEEVVVKQEEAKQEAVETIEAVKEETVEVVEEEKPKAKKTTTRKKTTKKEEEPKATEE